MGKHSKNNNDRAFFTYHERQAAKKGYASSAFYKHANGAYGGGDLKVGSDSLRDFDMCCLSLHPCRDPVITPQGILYEKEAIYEYILQKRKDNESALEAWAAQESSKAGEEERRRLEAHNGVVARFERAEQGISSGAGEQRREQGEVRGGAKSTVRGHVVNDDWSKHAKDSSFWAPQNAPTAVHAVDKPDTTIRCPMSGEPLRLKQLYPVVFTPAGEGDDDDAGASGRTLDGLAASERYVCPLSKKPLTNAARCVVLRPSGQVISLDSLDTIVKRDMLDPFCTPPAKLKERDIIAIVTEGTGFAARGTVEVKKKGAMVRRARPARHAHARARLLGHHGRGSHARTPRARRAGLLLTICNDADLILRSH